MSENEVIETTVSKVAAELASRGLDPDDRVTIAIEPDELIPGRRASRLRVIAAGLTDDHLAPFIQCHLCTASSWILAFQRGKLLDYR